MLARAGDSCSRLPTSDPRLPVLVEQPGVLATLSRWRSGVQIPSGTLKSSGQLSAISQREMSG